MLEEFARELESLRDAGLHRRLRRVEGGEKPRVVLEGRNVMMLCSNNYLGLADHARLKAAAKEAVDAYGTGSGASRLVSGTMELHETLERRIAAFKGTEAALVFNSGYAANTGIISALVGRGDVIFSDRLNHASIVDGAILSRARFVRYPHNDTKALRTLLEQCPEGGRRLIVTDGVFSMDGDMANLPELVALKREFGALLMVDDAHGTGVIGAHGRGTGEALGCHDDIDLQMGTLGKALGGFGAYVAARGEIIDYLVNKARSFIFSTSLPPAVLAAAIAAFEVVGSREGEELRHSLARKSSWFRRSLVEAGFDTAGSTTQIVPVIVGEADATMEFTRLLLEEGFFVQGIRPPTVPAGTCRLRCTIMATHDDSDLEAACAALISVGRKLHLVG